MGKETLQFGGETILPEDLSDDQKLLTMGRLLTRRRQQLGMSKKQAAQAAGITAGYLGKLEKGNGSPTLGVAYRLSRVFNIPLDTLAETLVSAGERQLNRELMELGKRVSVVHFYEDELPSMGFTQKQQLKQLLKSLSGDAQ